MMKKSSALLLASALTFGAIQAQAGMEQGMGKHHKAMHGKQKKKGMHGIFLIQRGLPHYSKILMKFWDDKGLGLSAEQKKKLEVVRNETIGGVKEYASKINPLRQKIVKSANEGVAPEKLALDVDQLADLKAEATKVQLKCIYETRKILTPEQLDYLHKKMKEMRKHHRKKGNR